MPLAMYAGAYLATPPRALLVVDEERYVAQAVAFANGARAIEGAGRTFHGMTHAVMSDYPIGTALLQAPFVALGGWRFAGLASVLALIIATLATAAAIRERGGDERFALLVPAFLGVAFFGRLGMSDVPSAMVVALALWMLFRAERGAGGRWMALGAGLVAGASVLFREPNILLLAPFLASYVLRRVAGWPLVVLGAAVGFTLRPLGALLLFGNAFYVRDSVYGFALSNVIHAAPLWLLILGAMAPGAILLPLLYRGERRWEGIAAVVMFLGLFASYGADMLAENGLVKGAVLTSRYAIPAMPLLALMAADVWPRVFDRLTSRVGALVSRATPVLAVGVGVFGVALQLVARQQEHTAIEIIQPLHEQTSAELPLVINGYALVKYVSPVYGVRQTIERREVDDRAAHEITSSETFNVALMDRTDSEMFRDDVPRNAAFLAKLEESCRVSQLYDAQPAEWARLRIYSVTDCVGAP